MLANVPNIDHLLKQQVSHPAQILHEGMLLLPSWIEGEGRTSTGWICDECL